MIVIYFLRRDASFHDFADVRKMVRNRIATDFAGFLRTGNSIGKLAPLLIAKYRHQLTGIPVFSPILIDMPDGIKRGLACCHL